MQYGGKKIAFHLCKYAYMNNKIKRTCLISFGSHKVGQYNDSERLGWNDQVLKAYINQLVALERRPIHFDFQKFLA